MAKKTPKEDTTTLSSKLIDGADSGSVSDKLKTQLFAEQLGICAAPDCNNRIHVDRTRLGECAHIIPRIVGSSPREDYKTPLVERKLATNLFYLCEAHHKFIDNEALGDRYPADLLRQWKETISNGPREWRKNLLTFHLAYMRNSRLRLKRSARAQSSRKSLSQNC